MNFVDIVICLCVGAMFCFILKSKIFKKMSKCKSCDKAKKCGLQNSSK